VIRPKKYDIKALKLNAEQGFVLSRVTSPMSLSEVVSLASLEEPRVIDIIRVLCAQGAVDVDEGTLPAAPPPEPAPMAVSLAVYGLSDVGHVRTNNEDCFSLMDLSAVAEVDASREGSIAVGPRGVLLVVSDGMGGANAGEVASKIVVNAVSAGVATSTNDDAAGALSEAVVRANQEVLASARHPSRTGMGATLVAVWVIGDRAVTAEVGDSRLYVVRNGTATLITRDQTYVQMLADQGLMTAEAAAASRARNMLLQAVGKGAEIVVAQRRLLLRNGDVIILCSDGLNTHVKDHEIGAAMAGSVQKGVESLVALTNERGGKDNVTVVAARVMGNLPAPEKDEAVMVIAIREATRKDPAPAS
jgi:serine/threonine protein phosphatase PrpC